MPLQRRTPKFGFTSLTRSETAEIRLNELSKIVAERVDLQALKNANIVSQNIKRAKVILSGKIEKAIVISGLMVTKGARNAIESCGGRIE